MILPVIMAGGSGSRLWPLSRQMFPKQFLNLYGNNTMLQETVSRISEIEHLAPLVICNEEHRFSVAEQFRKKNIKNSGIILEPIGRNTAPAIALAAFKSIEKGSDPILLVLAADHVISDNLKFCESLNNAKDFALQGKLVTFGIVPIKPETGYGYIKAGDPLGIAFNVSAFVEKPNLDVAKEYLASGEYYWNSGMFMFKASCYLKELKKQSPETYQICKEAIKNSQVDADFIRLNLELFKKCPDNSIDYAVMEKTNDAVVVPLGCGWSDVGSWSTLWDIKDKDSDGNASCGDVISIDTKNSYIHSTGKLIATIGLEDTIVVETKDAILISKKDQVQKVKEIVNKLKAEDRSEYKHHQEVYTAWGKFDSIDFGVRDQVKRITVKPSAKISVQMHHHRAEHWIIVAGTAKVTNGDKTFFLTENQSTYIPVGNIHALENPGKVPLEIIEVQSGSYLGEDDIVRFKESTSGKINE